MDFQEASRLGSLISKEYAPDFMRLLVSYSDISASEAAARLGLHIKTAQDFLEGLHGQGIVSKKEVFERKRPYFRYSLARRHITIDVDLGELYDEAAGRKTLGWRVREKKNSGVLFKTAPKSRRISSVTLFTGTGRSRREKKLSLTESQGLFLFHLPFPTEPYRAVGEIIGTSGIDVAHIPEILDIVGILDRHGIIERED